MPKLKRIIGESFKFSIRLMRGVRDRNNNIAYFDEYPSTLDFEYVGVHGGKHHYYATWVGIDIYLDSEKESELKAGKEVKLYDKEFA